MAVKTLDDINTQLSTGGSASKVEQNLIKDIVDSFVHADDLSADLDARVAENQADSVAADTATIVADFNALLAKLIAAGLMAAA